MDKLKECNHDGEVEELSKLIAIETSGKEKVNSYSIADLVIRLGYTRHSEKKVSPHELYDTAKGDTQKYKELMLAYGYLIPKISTPSPKEDPIECPVCEQMMSRKDYDKWVLEQIKPSSEKSCGCLNEETCTHPSVVEPFEPSSGLTVKDLVKLPEKVKKNKPQAESVWDNGWVTGYNQALSKIADLPVEYPKVPSVEEIEKIITSIGLEDGRCELGIIQTKEIAITIFEAINKGS